MFQAVRENNEDAREWQSGTLVAQTLIELDDFADQRGLWSGCMWCVTTVTSCRS